MTNKRIWNSETRQAFVLFSCIPRKYIFFIPDGGCLFRDHLYRYQKYNNLKMDFFWEVVTDKYYFRG